MSTSTPTAASQERSRGRRPRRAPEQNELDAGVRATAASERLLEDSWETRQRRPGARELLGEAAAGVAFLAAAGSLAVLAPGPAPRLWLAAALVILYAAISRIEFPIGAGYVVPSYLVLVPMLVLLPPGIVPLLTAMALVIGAAGQWLVRQAGPERMLFSIPDAWHAMGPAVVLVLLGHAHGGIASPLVYGLAFLAGCAFDLVSSTLREAAALQVAPKIQLRVLARVWAIDACLAPIGLLAAQAAQDVPGRVLLVAPLGCLLLILAHDRSERIVQGQRRLEQAFSDPLTGLGNRRLLADDLRLRLDDAARGILMLIDLDGFKGYNDTFGHLAGDALLARLGSKLATAVGTEGAAYRLGGDEFCVLVPGEQAEVEARLAAAIDALSEEGGEFRVQASYGAVLLPDEASDPDFALQLADERMYARKHGQTRRARDEARDVLMRTMQAREPELEQHSNGVAAIAARTARRLGMNAEEVDEVTRAAELHDLGKLGIPDAILDKPAGLDAGEWEYMRQHTILGERILSAAPALRPVANIVRSTHERWDGSGYPDQLAGERIPLSARIVSVCDAYEAMTSDRPYRQAISHAEACTELRREAGRQFDPAVVHAFLTVIANDSAPVEPRPEANSLDEVTAYLRELLAARRERAAA